jgi:GT2 family glycosyltransferase
MTASHFLAQTLPSLLFGFVFYYPFFMAYVWMAGGLSHAWVFERKRDVDVNPLDLLPSRPLVTVVVPCFNEAPHLREVIEQLMRSRYPNYEVIAVNDGSTDGTGELLDDMTKEYSRLRVIHNASNQGKAVSLNTACQLARGEYILGIDGDALVDEDAIAWMLRPMLASERIGAVTGNPRIRTRTTLLGRMQVGEFSSIIGLIKRSQQLVGTLFTVSGVIAMFRRRAVIDVGFWSPDVLTEDIDMSWKLQLGGWKLRFEARAVLDPDARDLARSLEAAPALGHRRHPDHAAQHHAHPEAAQLAHVAGVCRIHDQRGVGLCDGGGARGEPGAAVPAGRVGLALRAAAALAGHAAGHDLHPADAAEPVDRSPLRPRPDALFRRNDLVSDRVLDHHDGDHRHRPSQSPDTPPRQTRGVDEP